MRAAAGNRRRTQDRNRSREHCQLSGRSTALFLLAKGRREAKLVSLRVMRGAAVRSKMLDLWVGICTLWISCGFFVDAWAHGHVPVESFFTPYHAVFYAGMLALIIVLVVFLLRHGGLPRSYRAAAAGIAIFIAAGIGDMIWHQLLGVEEGIDALLSPTHQALGLGVFFVAAAPLLSSLRRRESLVRLADQLPLVFALATWIELVHFGTAYAFDPAAGRINAPPSPTAFPADYFTALTLGYYKLGTGVLVVIFQSALMAGFGLFAATRFSLRPGALTLMYLLGNFAAAAAFTNDGPLLATTIAMSLVAGVTGDSIVAAAKSWPNRVLTYRLLGTCIPVSYFATYFIATAIAQRLWWDWNVLLGAVIWAGAIGFALTLLCIAQPQRA